MDGTVLSGTTRAPVIDAHRKAQIVQTLMTIQGVDAQQVIYFHFSIQHVQITVVGDGANDLEMLALAGTGVAFCAKPAVQQQVCRLQSPHLFFTI